MLAISNIQEQFFSLVRSGLWNKPADQNLFNDNTNWNEIYEISKQQALLGIVLDGIETLPLNLRPGRSLYLKWCADVLYIEDNNAILNQRIGELVDILRKENIEPIILKGQGVARAYPNPFHRQSGDIDFYIGKNNFDRVNEILDLEGFKQHETNAKHSCYNWRDVIVENHRILIQTAPFINNRIQKIIDDWHSKGNYYKYNLEGKEISLPPLEFDIVYVLQHIVKHLLRQGIGLRQLCDWALLLNYCDGKIDKNIVIKLLKEFKLKRAAKIFGFIVTQYLGLPRENLILDYTSSDEKIGKQILVNIMNDGNFGTFNINKKNRPTGYWKRKLHSFRIALRKNLDSWKVVPYEVFWSPYLIIYNLLKSQYNKRKD